MAEELKQKYEEESKKLTKEYIIRRASYSFEKYEITKDYDLALKKYDHLREYVKEISLKIGEPEWVLELDRSYRNREVYNIIYPVGDPIFINVYRVVGEDPRYIVIEPQISKKDKEKLEKIQKKIVEKAIINVEDNDIEKLRSVFLKLYDEVISVGKRKIFSDKIFIKDKDEYERLKYFLLRDRFGYGKLEGVMRDTYLEDIHVLGIGNIWVVHKIFGMLKTNIEFKDEYELDKYIIKSSELVDRPVSEAKPIVDAILPGGSRVNFIYGRDISLHGSSFTIRKFTTIPLSITQLISFDTITPEEAAYLWIAIENGMNIFVVGETASGKTTTLNALTVFIRPDWKVYSVEDTPELNIPHSVWQRLVTRETGKSSDVHMYDLLRAALRSRPNYILIGEIRGKEGHVAFQAMQTGHPVMSTFHAGSLQQLIERLTGEPINVPISYIDNLNIVVLQGTIMINNKMERRVLSIYEIERYLPEMKRIAAREVFTYDRIRDRGIFRGKYNSYIMERKIAPILRLQDRKKIYDIIELRARILKRMVEEEIFNFFEVWEEIKNFYLYGTSGLSFSL